MSSLSKILFGASCLWFAVLRGARALSVKIYNYSFRSVSLTDMTVSLNLNFLVKNPLFVGLTIKSIQGDVYIQGENVGYVNTTINYYLSGGHTHVIPVIVNLDLSSVGTAAMLNIQSGDVRTLTIAFDGKMYVGEKSVEIPLKIDLDYNSLTK